MQLRWSEEAADVVRKHIVESLSSALAPTPGEILELR
jgi:hypothetical protein